MPEIKDLLIDVMKLANTDLLDRFKIKTDEKETVISAADSAGTFILNATMNDVYDVIDGEVGLTDLSYLRGLLNMKVFKDDAAEVVVTYKERNSETFPEEIHFKNADTIGTYRLQYGAAVKPMPWFINTKWDLEFSMAKATIDALGQMTGLLSDSETHVTTKVVDDNLVAFIGSEHGATNRARMTLTSGVSGNDLKALSLPIKDLLYVLRLGGENSTIRMKSDSVVNVEIKSDLGMYNFYITPAQ